MEIEYFRKQWRKVKTPFRKGRQFAGGTKFPLTRGVLLTDITKLPHFKDAMDYYYVVYKKS